MDQISGRFLNSLSVHLQKQTAAAAAAGAVTTNRQNSLGLPEAPGGNQPRRLSDCGPITQHGLQHQQGKFK